MRYCCHTPTATLRMTVFQQMRQLISVLGMDDHLKTLAGFFLFGRHPTGLVPPSPRRCAGLDLFLDGLSRFADGTFDLRGYIAVNPHLPYEEQRVIAGHELGHIFEHSNHLRCQAMQDFDIYQATGRLEREANFFAADLLLDDEEVLDLIHSGNTDFFSVAKELRIPAPFFAFKMYSLIRRGEHLQLPVDIDNRFLRAKH